MKEIKGDLIQLALEGHFDVIVHGCNCFNTMGAGLAKSIKKTFPEAYEKDRNTEKGDIDKLGHFTSVIIDQDNLKNKIIVVNAYTQYRWKRQNKYEVLADYEAIASVFKEIKTEYTGLRIGYPAIGAGLAGGNWNKIQKIIEHELENENHTFVSFSK